MEHAQYVHTTGMSEADDFEGWLESVKTARILAEWVEGATAEELVAGYRIGPGDLESRIERAKWLLGAAEAIAEVVGVDLPTLASTRAALAPDPDEEGAASAGS